MKQDERPGFVAALEQARLSAYPPGEFVGQESFMRAGEILDLASRAGVTSGVSVLDLCCGVAGPGRLIVAELGCDYLGLDYSPSAIDIARERARGMACRFDVARIPPLPSDPFDVVLLLETMLAFRDKARLLSEISRVLPVGGRFALTLEEGNPLAPAERRAMPDADTVWLIPLANLAELLHQMGLRTTWQQECTQSHLFMVDALHQAFASGAEGIAAHVGRRALDDLLSAHRLWSDWFRSGRVRKFALVVEKVSSTRVSPRR